jgi:hypothetical protein
MSRRCLAGRVALAGPSHRIAYPHAFSSKHRESVWGSIPEATWSGTSCAGSREITDELDPA